MDLSCGVIVTDGKQLLAIQPWGKKNRLDIPKGHIDPGETEVQCAARELFEETYLTIDEKLLKPLGTFPYSASKNLSLFLYRTQSLPAISMLKCTSYFTNPYGKDVPEAVGFEYASFEDSRFYESLKPLLRKVQVML